MTKFTRYKGFRIFGDAMNHYQVLDDDGNAFIEDIGLESTIESIDSYIAYCKEHKSN